MPCLFVFSLYYYINDFRSEIYVLQRKTQRLPNLTRVSKWNATLQKITRYEFVCLFFGRIASLKKHYDFVNPSEFKLHNQSAAAREQVFHKPIF